MGLCIAQDRESLLEVWANATELDPDNGAAALHALPESFRTVRVWSEIRPVQDHVTALKPAFEGLRAQAVEPAGVAAALAHHFRDESRALAWRESVDRVAAALRWAPRFERMRRYAALALAEGLAAVDGQRAALLELAECPHAFMEAAERDRFERLFEEFKSAYVDAYSRCHEELFGGRVRISSAALHNLEMLSDLHAIDKGRLDRIQVFGRWLKQNRCELRVREILQDWPRCHCNFNPAAGRHLVAAPERIKREIRVGIERCRTRLREASRLIIEELESMRADEGVAKQIAALLSRGPMIPLKPGAIAVLNAVIQRHSTAMRRQSSDGS
jgi:hypothetical protein